VAASVGLPGGFGVTDGTLVGGLSDALDGSGCAINGTQFKDPTGIVDVSTVATGTLVASNTASFGPLTAKMTFLFYNAAPLMRALCTVTNTSGSPQTVTIRVGFNLGSDGATKIEATSSGDTTLDPSDVWLVTSDAAPFNDPVLLWGRYGAGAQVTPTNVRAPGTPPPDRFVDDFTFTLQPGQSLSIMTFLQLNESIADATTSAPTFTNLTTVAAAGLLADLSSQEIGRIGNYATLAVPTLSEISQLALVLTVGATGYAFVMRRRRKADAAPASPA
jgi:hypothetical protein